MTKKQIDEIYYGKQDEQKNLRIMEKFKNSWVQGWEFIRNTAPMGTDHGKRISINEPDSRNEKTPI